MLLTEAPPPFFAGATISTSTPEQARSRRSALLRGESFGGILEPRLGEWAFSADWVGDGTNNKMVSIGNWRGGRKGVEVEGRDQERSLDRRVLQALYPHCTHQPCSRHAQGMENHGDLHHHKRGAVLFVGMCVGAKLATHQ